MRGVSSVYDFMIPQAADFADESARAAEQWQRLAQYAAFVAGADVDLSPEVKQRMAGTPSKGRGDPYFANPSEEDYRKIGDVLAEKRADDEKKAEQAAKEQAQIDKARMEAELAGLDRGGQIAYLSGHLETLDKESKDYYDNLEKINRLQRQAVEESQRDWEQAAKEVARKWEQEIDKVMSIPGLTGATPVTQQEMLESRFGIYRDNTDEWLRRAKDELITHYREIDKEGRETLIPRKGGQDWADVDKGEIARMLGLSVDLPGDVLYSRLEEAWTSGRLFADPANLGLLDEDALHARYDEMKAAEQGRINQRDYVAKVLGLSQADASLLTGTASPLVEMMMGGQSEKEIMGQIPDVGDMMKAQLEKSGGYMDALAGALKHDIDQNIKALEPAADRAARAFNDRFSKQLGSLGGLVDTITANVLEALSEEG